MCVFQGLQKELNEGSEDAIMSMVSLGAKQVEEISFLPCVLEVILALTLQFTASVVMLVTPCCLTTPTRPLPKKCTYRLKHWNRPNIKTWQGAVCY